MPGDITITADHNTDDALTNCVLFSACKTEINDFFNRNNSVNFETESIKSCLSNYVETFILVTGDITVTRAIITDITITNCTLFFTCQTEINDLFNQNNSANFKTETIKSSLCGYFDAFTLVTGDIIVIEYNNTDVVFTNCAPFLQVRQIIMVFYRKKFY